MKISQCIILSFQMALGMMEILENKQTEGE